MNQDQRHRLTLAFSHLEKFSVPGVGTFRRERVAARVDVVHGHVMPPSDRYLMEPGEHYISNLTDFLFRHLQVNHGAAEAMVRELGSAIRTEVEEAGKLDLPGVGVLTRDRLYGFQLEAADLQVPELFGLGEISYTPPRTATRTTTAAEKQRVIYDQIESNTVRVEPAPPPVGRRSSPVRWVVLISLMVMVAAGIGFWPSIKEQLTSMGWIGKESNLAQVSPTETTPSVSPSEPLQNPEDSQSEVVDDNQTDTAADVSAPETNESVTPPANADVTEEKVPDASASAKGRGSVAPVKGVHYLVVGSTRSEASALRIAKKLKASKYNVKVIRPGKRGYYRVTIFSSKDKNEVIRKMVEWKNDFPRKTYIYTH